MKSEDRIDLNHHTLEIEPSETECTLSSHRLCKACGADLTDRRPQAKFCSARCRTGARRIAHTKHLTNLIEVLDEMVAALRTLVGGRS
jgi:hypothetical protein